MNILKAYTSGLKETVRLPRPVFLIYLINLLIGVLIAAPLFGLMENSFGNSLNLKEILNDFNSLYFSDFIHKSMPGLIALVSQIKWMMLIYWIISIFLAGGIIRTLNQDKFTMTSFFSGSGYNFFRFLGISLLMLTLQIIVFVIVMIPTFLLIFSLSNNVQSDTGLVNIFFFGTSIWLILMFLIFIISDYAKFYTSLFDSKNIFKAVKEGFSYVFSNFLKTTGLYLLLVLIPGILLFGYYFAEAKIGTHTAAGVIVVFIIQQTFIFLRIWTRIWIYSSPLQMYTDDFLKREDISQRIELMKQWNEKALEQQALGEKFLAAEIDQIEHENKISSKVLSEEEMLHKIKQAENEDIANEEKNTAQNNYIKETEINHKESEILSKEQIIPIAENIEIIEKNEIVEENIPEIPINSVDSEEKKDDFFELDFEEDKSVG